MRHKKIPAYLLLFLCCFVGGQTTARWKEVSAPSAACLAVVIDDFGYGGAGEEELLELEIPWTAAVMPFSEKTEEDAQKARQAGKELLIHLPMESLEGKREWVGEKGIFLDMTEKDVRERVREAYDILPDAVGVNNHMGSAVMEQQECLGWVLSEVAERGGLFLDSMTTAESRGGEMAEKAGVAYLRRDVFLDSTQDAEAVRQNLRQAAEMAKRQGAAIAIGHVGPEGGKVTAQVLAEMAPVLEAEGVRFVFLSQLAAESG